tara:strand:+ start:2241 stop:3095 length:855 start_codon:yes stop_codon:yes gene_type:complete
MKKIGIIGQGFVGTAIREGLKSTYKIETYDKFKEDVSTCHSLRDVAEKCRIIFFCLPTPMRPNGSCDIRLLKKEIVKFNKICKEQNLKDRIAIIKSTVIPGTTDSIDAMCDNIAIIFSPEFLTEANHIEDFKNQSRIIVGGRRPASSEVKTMFRKAFPQTPIVKTSSKIAETVKYFINCFLATKVTYANEMFEICQHLDIDYDKVAEYALYDTRIGNSHLSVPGPDGDLGFGGHCFPKDLSAMISLAKNFNLSPLLLTAAQEKNNLVRSDRDWEKMKGRAVSDD